MLDHNPNLIDPSPKIKESCKKLEKLNKVQNGKKSVPRILTAKRQPPNLLRLLSLSMKRDHRLTNINKGDYVKCKDKRCMLCKQVIHEKSYKTKTGVILERDFNMSCKTKDLIYLLICKKCLDEYVGETGNELNLRTNVHRNQIEIPEYRKLKVSQHIHECSENKFLIFPYKKCFKSCFIYREELEMKIRNRINPQLH